MYMLNIYSYIPYIYMVRGSWSKLNLKTKNVNWYNVY